MQSDFIQSHQNFEKWLEQQNANDGKSSMWQAIIPDFGFQKNQTNLDDRLGRLFSPGSFRAYNFFYKKHESPGLTLKRMILTLTYGIARIANRVRNRIWQINVSGLGSDTLAFHPMGLQCLKSLGLDEGYFKFCGRFKLSAYSAAGIKSYYMASKILSFMDDRAELRVLEIGGGLGNLAAIINCQRPVTQYVIVDLPEMLLLSALALKSYFPETPFYFLYPGSADAYSGQKRGFYFCVPESSSQLESDAFDLGCNVDSFQEMTREQVLGYIELMQRAVREHGFVVNVNRRKYLTAEKYDNNPLMYPYFASNELLAWEIDYFMDRVLNYDHVRRDGWILRAEKVRKSALNNRVL